MQSKSVTWAWDNSVQICDTTYGKVPSGWNEVISMVVQRTDISGN